MRRSLHRGLHASGCAAPAGRTLSSPLPTAQLPQMLTGTKPALAVFDLGECAQNAALLSHDVEKPMAQGAAVEGAAAILTRSGSDGATAACRVCLEEDSVADLMAPCSCTGSMMVRHWPG